MTPCPPVGARIYTRDSTIPHPFHPGPPDSRRGPFAPAPARPPRTGRTSPCRKHHGPGRALGRGREAASTTGPAAAV